MQDVIRKLINVSKPEYVFRPQQVWRRMSRLALDRQQTVFLPWGLPLRVCLDDVIGRQIWAMGVFELVVSEVLWRLADPGERAVDVGANIGYTSSILASRVGISGMVLGFEPNPEVYSLATANVASWEGYAIAPVVLDRSALSDSPGRSPLSIPGSFDDNCGLSSLTFDGSGGRSVTVEVTTLDSVIDTAETVGILKIDVEGHEARVLAGGTATLARRAVRDILFEDHNPYPSQATEILDSHGYRLFRIDYSWWKPVVADPHSARSPGRLFDTPNFLATLDPERARGRLAGRGWRCLTAERIGRRNVLS